MFVDELVVGIQGRIDILDLDPPVIVFLDHRQPSLPCAVRTKSDYVEVFVLNW